MEQGGDLGMGVVRDTCLCRIRHKHVYAARHIMSVRARTIAKKSIYSNGLCHIQRGHIRGIILGAFATPSVANRLDLYPLRY